MPYLHFIENLGIQSIPVAFCPLSVYNQIILRDDRNSALLDERKQLIV